MWKSWNNLNVEWHKFLLLCLVLECFVWNLTWDVVVFEGSKALPSYSLGFFDNLPLPITSLSIWVRRHEASQISRSYENVRVNKSKFNFGRMVTLVTEFC